MINIQQYFMSRSINENNIYDHLDDVAIVLNGYNTYQNLLQLIHLYHIDLDRMLEYFHNNNLVIRYNYMITRFFSMGKKDLVIKYLDYFIDNNHRLLELKKILKNNNVDVTSINRKINESFDLIIEEITSKSCLSLEQFKEFNIYEFIKQVIIELLRNEKIKLQDIEYISSGSVTSVYKIGSKVLKIGDKRNNFNIKNNSLFLKPLLRKEIYDHDKFLLCVEITEKLDTKSISDADVYYVYKLLREQGLVWIDPSISNIGRLIRDNKIYFDNISYVDKVNTGYLDDNNTILKSGNIVFADNEYIYNYEMDRLNPRVEQFLKDSPYEYQYLEEKRKTTRKIS